ncbi:hypothetical protein C9374_003887 [Naegleria lovaniensis]|uniref:Tryptophan 2,3-dioxygenase n=1 Tax=Naegleria lovaniensis TaxID=51637 RepID=A0AA88H428_NAELO|nr:uncharacterized protein C9374_003887 [Naegleria lovaniensis]KAG2394123.1 hypothetical protein C9374_003887 [Naegleria lovaniensis]
MQSQANISHDQIRRKVYSINRNVDVNHAVPLTYDNYIRAPELIQFQYPEFKGGLNHHDEHLFIVIHQGFEIWFKQILFEIDSAVSIMKDPTLFVEQLAIESVHEKITRAGLIMKTIIPFFDVMETMHPLSFLEFRDFLGPGSGMQSIQMREIETTLGVRHEDRVHIPKEMKMASQCPLGYGASNHDDESVIDENMTAQMKKLSERYHSESTTVKSLIHSWLEKCIHPMVPENFEEKFLQSVCQCFKFQRLRWRDTKEWHDYDEKAMELEKEKVKNWINGNTATTSHHVLDKCPMMAMTQNQVQNRHDIAVTNENGSADSSKKRRLAILFIMCYRHIPGISHLSKLIDSLLSFEEQLLLWRNRHVKLVENYMGTKIGTGGLGLKYLNDTLGMRIFDELWQARSYYVATSWLPELKEGSNQTFQFC